MFAVERWFCELPEAPDHVVAVAFEANLPFVEHQVLDRLHRGGARHLTVLVGAQDYRESFADLAATRHAGVFYAYHRVRLPGTLAAFHPKLYLATWSNAARLLVTSANLTPTGFRSNLEIADELQLTAGKPGDVHGFSAYASLLEALPSLDTRMEQRVAGRLRAAAEAIKALAGRCHESESGTVLLHSATRPLLAQLREHVPLRDARRITLISPFFDARSTGVLSLVRAFTDERRHTAVRLIKDSKATGELDGRALRVFGDAIQVEALIGLTGEPEIVRRLHAKVLVLEGARGSWLVTGSANATSAAWLRSASAGGNLEAVTVRRLSTGEGRALLSTLVTERVEHDQLVRELDHQVDTMLDDGPVVHSASVVGELVEVRCARGPWTADGSRYLARITSREGSRILALDLADALGDTVVLRSRIGCDVVHSSASTALVLEVLDSSGARLTSEPVWVDKPMYQDLHPSLRAGVRALSQLGEATDVDDPAAFHDAAQFLADLTVRIAADMRVVSPEAPDSNQWSVTETGQNDEDDLWVDGDLEGSEEVGASRSHPTHVPSLPGGATVRRLAGPHVDVHLQMAQRLFDGLVVTGLEELEEDEAAESAAARRRMRALGRGASAGGPDADDEGRLSDQSGPRPLTPSGRRLLQQGLESLRRSVGRVLASAWSPEKVPRHSAALDALLAAFLRYATYLRDRDEGLRQECHRLLQEAWARIWSTDGYLQGPCRGLYARALTDPTLAQPLRELYAKPERLSRVAAMAALSAVLRRTEGAVGAKVPPGILSGITLVSGAPTLAEERTASLIAAHAAAFAANVADVARDDLLVALTAVPLGATADGALLRTWLPLIRVEQARRRGDSDATAMLDVIPSTVPERLVSRYRDLVRSGRKLSSMTAAKGKLFCNACRSALPVYWRTQIAKPEFIPVCESCRKLLAPVAWEDPRVAATISGLASTIERHDPPPPAACVD